MHNIHLKLLKQFLGVHSKTSNPTIYGEFARFPLSVIRKNRLIRYWYKSLLSSLGYAYMWNNANVSGVILNDTTTKLVLTIRTLC